MMLSKRALFSRPLLQGTPVSRVLGLDSIIPLLTTNNYARSYSDRGGGNRKNFRLKRPTRVQKKQHFDSRNVLGSAGPRPHTVILFPGDYSDNVRRDMEENEFNEQPLQEDAKDVKERERIVKEEIEKKKKKEKWLENAKPTDWKVTIDDRGRAYGKGGRKRAQARVWIQPGFGEVVVNRKAFTSYFERDTDRDLILQPLVATETVGKFDVVATVKGGGITGQAGAISHGVARALNAYNPDLYRPPLKFLGYMTRDSRIKEEKKTGLVKARKAPQWVRR